MKSFLSRSEDETIEIGRRLGEQLQEPLCILLYGPLGAGKTVLVRGLARGLGIIDPSLVRSPTFTLVHEYPSRRGGLIYHLDLYRLDTLQEQLSVGLDEILSGDHFAIVEWAEKLLVPVGKHLAIRLEADPTSEERHIRIQSLPPPPA